MSAQLSFPSGANNNTKWKKRKRDNTINNNNNTPNTKKHRQQSLQQQEEDDEDEEDLNEDDEEEIEPEIEEDEDLQPIPSTVPPPQPVVIQNPKEEVLSDGGNRISDFPIVIQHTVNRFHSSVLSIVSAERQAQFPNNNQNPNPNFFLIENISYGQLQALSSVPADNLSLATSTSDLNDRSDAAASYVCTPPPIMEGRGVVKRFDGNNNGPALVVPMHADWFTPNTVHRLERQVVPYFFSGKSADHTPEKYMECRNRVVAKYMENPETRLWTGDCQNLVDGIDVHDLNRIVRFLDHWGIINYSAPAPNRDPRIGGPFLREESNGEIHIPSPALRSIYSLIHFDKPKSRIRPTDICPMLSSDGDEVADLDQRIRERLTENHCHHCSQPLPRIYYQSQKESDILLCSDCFHEGRFVVGHSSIDFMKVDSAKALCDLDGDSWTDQETLLLLEAVEVYHDNWNDIADHVGTKSKAQCILHFVRLPMEDGVLENIDVPIKLVSSNTPNLDDGGTPHPRSNGDSARLYPQDLDSESRLPFANSRNPVMALVAFLASAVGPRVAAACAHASLAELSKEENQLVASGNKIQTDGSVDRISTEGMWSREGGHHGSPRLSHQKENQDGSNALSSAPLSTESVKVAAKVGLAAAAMKAKLFADHEEREIQRMAASIINHQLKRLELKLKQFAEVETLLMKEGEQVEKARQRLAAERVHVISTRFVPGGALNANMAALQGAVAAPVGNNLVNSSRQVGMPGGSPVQTNMIPGGYGNNTAVATHPHMSFMPRQPMFSYGPRLPLSAIHPSSSSLSSPAAHPATTMYNAAPPAGNAPPTLGHTMLRPVSGNNANVG